MWEEFCSKGRNGAVGKKIKKKTPILTEEALGFF